MARVHLIGCAVLAIDIARVAEKNGLDITTRFLPGGLHNEPARLKRELQAAIDETAGQDRYDRIAVGYGVCGLGSVGIQARDRPLVFPRAHDCIAMFLGSNTAYKREFSRYPGTFYFSAGWCAEKVQPRSSEQRKAWMGDREVTFEALAAEYGREHADTVMNFLSSWQKNYQRAAFIDTGAPHKERYAQNAIAMARKYGWKHENIPGDLRLLEALLTADQTGDDILVVPPGYFTAFDPIKGELIAAPPDSRHQTTAATPDTIYLKNTDAGDTSAREDRVRFGLGVDAGGTYTDAVIYDFEENRLRGKNKALTTRWDFTIGIEAALDGLPAALMRQVELVAVSTTLATNAIVEGEGQPVGLILMPPYGRFDPADIPYEPKAVIDGQLEITGVEKCPPDPAQVRRVARRMVEKNGVTAFAVSGFAGSVNPAHELIIKQALKTETGLSVTCGHELSDMLDFKTRARTAVLNARIIPRLEKFIGEMGAVLSRRGIAAPMVVVKGDGSLMAAETARDRPVETVFSGPAASVAGALHLTGCKDAIVVDIGGTTTDTAGLKGGQVRICESGTIIGGVKTHVRALDMRTAGLGGDSAILWEKGVCRIGPQRLAPVSWLGHAHGDGLAETLRFMENRLHLYRADSRPMQILVRVGASPPARVSADEKKILDLLDKRPFSLDELARRTGAGHWRLLDLARLEINGGIQRCGLTPTDLLHVTGRLDRWDTATARRMAALMAEVTGQNQTEMVAGLLEKVTRQVAEELLKKQLDEEVEAEEMENCPVCRQLLDNLFAGGNAAYTVKIAFHRPVIGIGAPAACFVPRAAEWMGTEAILPSDADVANAVGAITSEVMVRQQVWIAPDNDGAFLIEGIEGARRFTDFDQAHAWALDELKRRVRDRGRAAGTSRGDVEISFADNISSAGDGTRLFLGRTITASLKGRPDRGLVAGLNQGV